MNEIKDTLEVLTCSLMPLILGFGAAIARVAKHGWHGLPHFSRELVLSCFYGVVMYWILDLCEFAPTVKAGLTSGGAYAMLEIGNVLFEKLESIIKNFELSDVLPTAKRKKDWHSSLDMGDDDERR